MDRLIVFEDYLKELVHKEEAAKIREKVGAAPSLAPYRPLLLRTAAGVGATRPVRDVSCAQMWAGSRTCATQAAGSVAIREPSWPVTLLTPKARAAIVLDYLREE